MLPVVGTEPLQPPEAVHAVALVAFHCSVTEAPIATLVSLAFKVTNGGETTAGVPGPPEAGGVEVGVELGGVVSVDGDVNALEL